MPPPATRTEILAALEASGRAAIELCAGIPEAAFFSGDSDHWSPAHHLAHLAQASAAVARGLRSGRLPLHPTGRSRPYLEVRDAASAAVAATAKPRLLEMGRRVVLTPGAARDDVVREFSAASADLRAAAEEWADEALDRHAMPHPLMGWLTVREMLMFTVFHEKHHTRRMRELVEAA
jgi:nucleoside-diphosphate-sugar epimerase